MKIGQIIAQVATMKNADCVPPGRQVFPGPALLYVFLSRLFVRRAASRLSHYYPRITLLRKFHRPSTGKRENTIDGSAIFRAIEQEASRRCCKGKKQEDKSE